MEKLFDQATHSGLCDSYKGNAIEMLLAINVSAKDAVDDVRLSPPLPGGLVYTGIEIMSSGNTAGLELDIGYKGHGEDRRIDPEPAIFGSAVAVAAAGRQQLLNVPLFMRLSEGRQVHHQLTAKLGGTLTPGDTVYVLIKGHYAGIT